jgi:hypothetical protein
MIDAFCTSGNSPTKEQDLLFENHVSIFLVRAVSKRGLDWLEANVNQGGFQPYFPFAIVCEPRHVESILQGATADGLVCR